MSERTAANVNRVEEEDPQELFLERLSALRLNFDSAHSDTRIVCIAVITAADYIAKMIAACHHDEHGTVPIGNRDDGTLLHSDDD